MPSNLLDEGREQLLRVGKLTAAAYVALENAEFGGGEKLGEVRPSELTEPQPQPTVGALFSVEDLRSKPHLIRVRSSDIERTLASGAFLLEGLGAALRVQLPALLPVFTHALEFEPLVTDPSRPRVKALLELARKSEGYRALEKKFAPLRRRLREELALPEERLSALWPEVLCDCLLTYVCDNRSAFLPASLRPSKADDPSEGSLLPLVLQAMNEESAYLYGWGEGAVGFYSVESLLKELRLGIESGLHASRVCRGAPKSANCLPFSETETKTSSEAEAAGANALPRLHLYLTHDVTLLAMLSALRVHTGRWPPYASVFAVEVFRRGGSASIAASSPIASGSLFFFRLWYNA